MSFLFTVSIISASYCGWLHYIEEINKPSKSSLKVKRMLSPTHYLYFITGWIGILLLIGIFLI
jgi:hypothetical protein